ncbi:MAG: hypothetical protein DIU69_10570, partial [Bacillota bacterium]
MTMSRGGARRLAFHALLVAIVAVATMVIQVPMPGTQGQVFLLYTTDRPSPPLGANTRWYARMLK